MNSLQQLGGLAETRTYEPARLSRRAFLRGGAAVVATGVATTPLWARWLNDEMKKLEPKPRITMPQGVMFHDQMRAWVYAGGSWHSQIGLLALAYAALAGQLDETKNLVGQLVTATPR